MDEEKRRLLADISHDLKTPLTVIQGYADALRDGMVPEEEREACLRVISQRTQRVNELPFVLSRIQQAGTSAD